MEKKTTKKAEQKSAPELKSSPAFRALMEGPLAKTLRAAGVAIILLPEGGCVTVRARERDAGDIVHWRQDHPEPVGAGELSFEAMRERLIDQLGEDGLRSIVHIESDDTRPTFRADRQRELLESGPQAPTGFAETFQVPDERISRFIRGAFPRSWISRENLTAIRAENNHYALPSEYGIRGFESGHCIRRARGSEIVITDPARWSSEHREREVLREVAHEIGHCSDLYALRGMDPQVRVRFAYRFLERMQAQDGLRFSYVESIHNANPRQERVFRLVEYMAEVTSVVFQPHPWHADATAEQSLARQLSEQHDASVNEARLNIRLVRDYARASDPQFDFDRSQRFLDRLDAELQARIAADVLQEAIDGMTDPTLRAMVGALCEGRTPAPETHPIRRASRYHPRGPWTNAFHSWENLLFDIPDFLATNREQDPRHWEDRAMVIHADLTNAEFDLQTAVNGDADPEHLAEFRHAVMETARDLAR